MHFVMNSGISDNCKPFHSLLTGVGKTTIELNIAPVCVCVNSMPYLQLLE